MVSAWAVELILISIRDLSSKRRLPYPSEVLASFVVFGTLTAIGGTENGRKPAAAIAWGLVIATILGNTSTLNAFTSVSQFMQGNPNQSQPAPTTP
ncbi:MAG: hypothetical protein ACREMY_00880 [bacterium]